MKEDGGFIYSAIIIFRFALLRACPTCRSHSNLRPLIGLISDRVPLKAYGLTPFLSTFPKWYA